MTERFDFIAIGPYGVYALCEDILGCDDGRLFCNQVKARGHRVERVTVAEACRRHLEFLNQNKVFAEVFKGSSLSASGTLNHGAL
jgi:uncharacterized protein YciU (UPF0263 family)